MDYNLNYYNAPSAGGIMATLLVPIIISSIISVIMIVALWKVFTKAGKPGWASIVPIYNSWVLFEIGGQNGAYIFFSLIPCVGPIIFLVYEIKAMLEIAKRFGKTTGFGVLMIFFPYIAFLILAFSNASYSVAAEPVQSSILDVDTQGVSNEKTFNYGYETNNTASAPVEQAQNVEVASQESTEPVVPAQVEESDTSVVSEEPVNTAASQEQFNSSVDRFHTPSALDKKDE